MGSPRISGGLQQSRRIWEIVEGQEDSWVHGRISRTWAPSESDNRPPGINSVIGETPGKPLPAITPGHRSAHGPLQKLIQEKQGTSIKCDEDLCRNDGLCCRTTMLWPLPGDGVLR